MKKTFISAAIAATLFTSFAQAETAPAPALEPVAESQGKTYPGVLGKVVRDKGVVVKEEFAVSDKVKGYLIKDRESYSVLYAVDDMVFTGIVFDKNGANLSAEHNRIYIPKPDMGEIVADVEKRGSYVEEGADAGKPVIYVFSDPNCGHCKNMYKQVRPLVDKKEVTIRWIEVGILQNAQAPTSRDKAAYILKAEDKTLAKMRIELGYAPEGIETKDYRAAAINYEIMKNAGFSGTPTLIYHDGKQWVSGHNMSNEKLKEVAKVAPIK